MEIRQLRHLVAIVDARSIKRAAEVLHVSQQGLSKSIHALEFSLGTQLLERGRFGVRPTEYGKSLVARARVICGHAQLARDELRALVSGEAGSVSIGIGPYFEGRIISDVILRLSRLRPKVSVRVWPGSTDELVVHLLAGDIDFSVSTPSHRYRFPPEIDTHLIFKEKEVALMRRSHPLAGRKSCSIRELCKFPWVLSARAAMERERITNIIREHSSEWPPRIVYADSTATVANLLARDNYIHISAPAMLIAASSKMGLVDVAVNEIGDYRAGILASRRDDVSMPASQLAKQIMIDIGATLQ